MRLSTSYHLLAFLAFVAVSVSADPLSDISRTSVDLGAGRQTLKSDSPRFSLIVHRTDDLVDENAGTLVAERQVEIQMDFDVTATGEDNSLLLNGVPVQAGISGVQVQVEAEMMINRARVIKPDGTIDHEKKEGVESAFDVGLVTVEVFVRAATMDVQLDAFLPPVPIRRFSLMERVIEINGQSVVQTDIGEQVFYFGPGGDFIGIIEDAEWSDVTQGEENSILASQPVKSPSMDCRVARIRTSFKSWFNGLPFALKFLIGFAWAAVGILWGLFLTSRIALIIRRAYSGYKSVDVENTAETLSKDYSDDVKDMEFDVETCEGLPKYGSENEEKAPADGDSEKDELCK